MTSLKTIDILITAESPLVFARAKPDTQFRESLDYIPGSAILGALAQILAEQNQLDPAQLRQVRCANAYPSTASSTPARPKPFTAIQPKGDDKVPTDSLIERVCWEQQQPPALIYAPTDLQGRPYEAAEAGFFEIVQDEVWKVNNPSQRMLTRVAINRRRNTAEDQRLYSPLVLSEVYQDRPMQYRASIRLPANDSTLETALLAITQVGGRQTSGLGLVQVTKAAQPSIVEMNLAERITRVTTRFQEIEALYERLGGRSWPIADQSLFTINLVSDAILLDQGWLPASSFNATMLHDATGIDARLVRAFTNIGVAGGWNVSWQRQKVTNATVLMGSLFLFQSDRPLDSQAIQRLEQLQIDGIGERRQEGYGQIRVCDEFHVLGN